MSVSYLRLSMLKLNSIRAKWANIRQTRLISRTDLQIYAPVTIKNGFRKLILEHLKKASIHALLDLLILSSATTWTSHVARQPYYSSEPFIKSDLSDAMIRIILVISIVVATSYRGWNIHLCCNNPPDKESDGHIYYSGYRDDMHRYLRSLGPVFSFFSRPCFFP